MLDSKECISLCEKYGAHNYHPLPVVFSKAKGIWITDPEGREYMDFLSAYSAVNHGHCHPRIIEALEGQLKRVTLTSRAFHNDLLGLFLKELCEYTNFEMALPMNTGAEAVETALKLARKWGVEKKGIKNGQQEIIVCDGNFHGRTITIVSFSTDPDARVNYGPYTEGFKIIPYDDAQALEQAITKNTCAFLFEPIQGEAGVFVPSDGYLKQIREICTKNNVLMVADEIQTGFCRTGKKFAVDYENIKPDVMTLGKALGGGVFPASAVVADKDIMEVFTPGSHGSTFGGNPLACAVSRESLKILDEDDYASKAYHLGEIFRKKLKEIKNPQIVSIRGKGLLNAVEFNKGFKAWDVCVNLKNNGLLAKQTHDNIIRFAPPLMINEQEIDKAIDIIKSVL